MLCLLFSLITRADDYQALCSALGEHSLPLVNITFEETQLQKSSFIPCSVEFADYHRRLPARRNKVCFKALIRHRGGISTQYEKRSFAIKLRDDEGKKLRVNLFDIRSTSSWILDAMAVDRLRMRNRVCFDLWNEISPTPYPTEYGNRNGTEGVFVEVFVNGSYEGLYCLTDKIDRRLLSLQKTITQQESDTAVNGVLYKGVAWKGAHGLRQYDYLPEDEEQWLSYELKYPEGKITKRHWLPLKSLVDFCSKATSDNYFKAHWSEWFYEQNMLDYMVLLFAMNIGDAPYKNTYLSVADYSRDRRFLITPWDMDMSLGGNYDGAYLDTLTDVNRLNDIAPYDRLYADNVDDLRTRTHQRMLILLQTTLAPERIDSCISRYSTLFEQSGAWQREVQRWNNNPVALKDDINEEIGYVSSWYRRNHAYLFAYAEQQLEQRGAEKKKEIILWVVFASFLILILGGAAYIINRININKNHILL